MLEAKPIKFKLCLVGECAVGKTSLIRRYVLDQFDDTYIGTIGTKVTKREIKIPHPENGRMVDIHLLIWDIIGEPAFRMLVQESYFFGAQGMIAVCDFTRKDTLSALEGWMESAQGITGEIPTAFLANKCDLEHEQQMELNEIREEDEEEESDEESEEEEIDWEEILNDEDNFEIKQPREQKSDDLERPEPAPVTLMDHLFEQLHLSPLSDEEMEIGTYILWCIDDDGYLACDVEHIAENFDITLEKVEKVLSVIQRFDPVGIGARNLQECLLIQPLTSLK